MQAVPDPAVPSLASPSSHPSPAQRLSLLNAWQRGFPLCDEPFAVVGAALDMPSAQVLQAYRQLAQEGALSRIGAVFAPGSGGASVLAAMAVPPDRLEAVAAVVSAHPGVNHNYERENTYNLWFVLTGASDAQVQRSISGFLVGFCFGMLFYGPLSDRFGRRPVLLAGIAWGGYSLLGRCQGDPLAVTAGNFLRAAPLALLLALTLLRRHTAPSTSQTAP